MEQLLKSKNSVLLRNVIEVVGNLSEVGTMSGDVNYDIITLPRKWHREYFLYAVVYYNIENHDFELAIARNTRECEAVGVICSLDENTVSIATSGYVQYTPSYNEIFYDDGCDMYLSDTIPGKLVFETPERVIKRIARFHKNAIMIDIGTGQFMEDDLQALNEFQSYTQEELDDIISDTWWEERHAQRTDEE